MGRTTPYTLQRTRADNAQGGSALIFGLVLLLVLTILGLGSAGTSNLELRMSGNALESSRVFQAAERARVAAEKVAADAADSIRAGTGVYSCNGAAGLRYDASATSAVIDPSTVTFCTAGTGLVTDLRNYDWANGSTSVASLDSTDSSEGRYIVEYLGVRQIAPDRNVSTRDVDPPVNAFFFRLSVRGRSASGGETYVRSYYMR